MSMSDVWHAPLIESTKLMSNERTRFDSLGSEVIVGVGSQKPDQDGRAVENAGQSNRPGERSFGQQKEAMFAEQNTAIQAQEYGSQDEGDLAVKRGIAIVASASEAVGAREALARLDQNGDGRIDLVEVQKGQRADEDSTTFAALTQYKNVSEGVVSTPRIYKEGSE
jgi:hypothetical protein